MMAREKFRRFRFIGFLPLLLLVLFTAARCGTTQKAPPTAQVDSSASGGAQPVVEREGDRFKIELSSESVIDAGVLVVVARPKKDSKNITDLHGKFGDIEFPMFDSGDGGFEGVLGIPLDTSEGPHQIHFTWKEAGVDRGEEVKFNVKSGNYPTETISVEPKKVNPPKSAMPRIQREVREFNRVYHTLTPRKLWNGVFRYPVGNEPTSVFGTRRVYNGTKKSPHMGLDLRAKTGTAVLAPAAGIVALAKDTYFAGGTIILDHGWGIFSVYAHLSKIEVKVGQTVKVGERLALSGATGRVTGPHLHWGAQINGVKVNPAHLTEVMR